MSNNFDNYDNTNNSNKQDTRNIVIFVIIAVILFLGYFAYTTYINPPPADKKPVASQSKTGANNKGTTNTNGTSDIATPDLSGTDNTLQSSTNQALAKHKANTPLDTPRLKIESSGVSGSIALKGAFIDDVTLKNYYKTVAHKTKIILLKKRGLQNAYYSNFGWVLSDKSIIVPNKNTLWSTNDSLLTETKPVTLFWKNPQGVTFFQDISIDKDFMFTIKQRVKNESNKNFTVYPYAKVVSHGTPEIEANVRSSYIMHIGFIGSLGKSVQREKFLKLFDKDDQITKDSSEESWVGMTTKSWLVAVAPAQQKTEITAHMFGLNKDALFPTLETNYISKLGIIANAGQEVSYSSHLFAGAKEIKILNKYRDTYHLDKFDYSVDWGWFSFITKPLFLLLNFLATSIGHVGIAILVLTLIVKSCLFPLAYKSSISMNKMKIHQPELKALKEKYGDDKTRIQKETMAIYKRHKINPASGCLPMIIQVPIFFSLYKVFYVTIEMRQQPFFGWIHDLTSQDPTTLWNLFGLIPYNITEHLPFQMPQMLHLGAWPILLGISMWFQQRANPQPTDPTQAKIMKWLPVIFTLMLSTFPVGLVIYWTWNNSLTAIQQFTIQKLNLGQEKKIKDKTKAEKKEAKKHPK